MVALRILVPPVRVRVLPGQRVCFRPRNAAGLVLPVNIQISTTYTLSDYYYIRAHRITLMSGKNRAKIPCVVQMVRNRILRQWNEKWDCGKAEIWFLINKRWREIWLDKGIPFSHPKENSVHLTQSLNHRPPPAMSPPLCRRTAGDISILSYADATALHS